MIELRLCKVLIAASLALFADLVAIDNVLDYGSNYTFVRHVLSMDTTFPDNALRWRAITQPMLWHVAYGSSSSARRSPAPPTPSAASHCSAAFAPAVQRSTAPSGSSTSRPRSASWCGSSASW